jgi:hypothetical protein
VLFNHADYSTSECWGRAKMSCCKQVEQQSELCIQPKRLLEAVSVQSGLQRQSASAMRDLCCQFVVSLAAFLQLGSPSGYRRHSTQQAPQMGDVESARLLIQDIKIR